MPDIHSGYGFAVGNVAAFDMDDPASIVSPGGVGFDINCGVRLIRTGMLRALNGLVVKSFDIAGVLQLNNRALP